jgi:hypothetical protein
MNRSSDTSSQRIEDSQDTVSQNGSKASSNPDPPLSEANVKESGDDSLGYAGFLAGIAVELRLFGSIFILFGVVDFFAFGSVLAAAGPILIGVAGWLLSYWTRSGTQSG